MSCDECGKALEDAEDHERYSYYGYISGFMDLVSVGSLNQSIVHPREVFKSACLSNATALILIHQHPSGDSSPSSEEIAITRRLKEAGEILGIKVLDHIIVGDGKYQSFVERGLL